MDSTPLPSQNPTFALSASQLDLQDPQAQPQSFPLQPPSHSTLANTPHPPPPQPLPPLPVNDRRPPDAFSIDLSAISSLDDARVHLSQLIEYSNYLQTLLLHCSYQNSYLNYLYNEEISRSITQQSLYHTLSTHFTAMQYELHEDFTHHVELAQSLTEKKMHVATLHRDNQLLRSEVRKLHAMADIQIVKNKQNPRSANKRKAKNDLAEDGISFSYRLIPRTSGANNNNNSNSNPQGSNSSSRNTNSATTSSSNNNANTNNKNATMTYGGAIQGRHRYNHDGNLTQAQYEETIRQQNEQLLLLQQKCQDLQQLQNTTHNNSTAQRMMTNRIYSQGSTLDPAISHHSSNRTMDDNENNTQPLAHTHTNNTNNNNPILSSQSLPLSTSISYSHSQQPPQSNPTQYSTSSQSFNHHAHSNGNFPHQTIAISADQSLPLSQETQDESEVGSIEQRLVLVLDEDVTVLSTLDSSIDTQDDELSQPHVGSILHNSGRTTHGGSINPKKHRASHQQQPNQHNQHSYSDQDLADEDIPLDQFIRNNNVPDSNSQQQQHLSTLPIPISQSNDFNELSHQNKRQRQSRNTPASISTSSSTNDPNNEILNEIVQISDIADDQTISSRRTTRSTPMESPTKSITTVINFRKRKL